jgi:hypothetical protein
MDTNRECMPYMPHFTRIYLDLSVPIFSEIKERQIERVSQNLIRIETYRESFPEYS